ncbi:MAG: hypothetical protein IJT71_04700, partial [Oscillospiraceae bacterium]|nr:hypothetical protein [Oscillospiraceae bacterium]
MKPLKTLLSLALCAALTLGLAPAARAASSVRVKLPAFPVTLGAQTVDPANEEYPFLVYKDVTYLPLTYYGCRLLGLYAKWSPESGLTISDAGAKGAYQPTPRVSRNGGALYAQIAAGKITICNKTIDNNSEEYPFLLFRDVTYLPMTWANLHDLLGCVYTFDGARGLTIDRAADGSASVLDLPRYNGEGSVAAWQGWFWYQDADGWISRAPMAGGASEKLFELPINVMYTDAPAWASLTVSDGKLYMTYHLGGATMGHDESYRFHADGTYVTLVKRNGPVGEFDGVWLHANGSLMPSPGNLRVSYDEGATWEQFGSEHHVYGWSYHGSKGGGASASYTASGIYKADGYAYLLATDAANWGSVQPDANGDYPEQFSAVCRVDLESGETTEIAPNAAAFRLAGGAVWYATFDGELRRCALDGSGDELALRPKDGW